MNYKSPGQKRGGRKYQRVADIKSSGKVMDGIKQTRSPHRRIKCYPG